jgi:twitching motility protein PilT
MWQTFEEKGELDFSYSVPGISRFRVNAYRQRTSVAIAIRIIPSRVPSLEELSLPPILNSLVDKPQGLILVTGPTGSGKSTTLASMIDYMNRTMKKHIITLEDPIEYLHRHNQCMIDQREVGFDTKSFATGLRASLRQDPDVILVGELRDLETIQTAITAAETGHLVLGTLHTTSAPSTIDRIIDVFPGPQQAQIRIQLASVLVSIISQRLFPSLDRQSRKVATEILVNTPAVANLIRNEKIHQIQNVMQTSRALGMHTLEMSIRQLIQNSEISRVSAESFLQETVN